jgi:hypothetical protein
LWRLSLIFADIALHRRGPEQLPSSRFLFALLLAVFVVVNIAATQIVESLPRAAAMVLFDTALYVGFFWVLLTGFGYSARFLQTVSALLGAETLLTLIGIPVLMMAGFENGEAQTPNVGTWLFLLLILWSIDVAGFVTSRALQLPYFLGVLIVLVYTFSSFTLGGLLFPVTS